MAKKTAKPTKTAKPRQGPSLGEEDIRRVVENVMAELAKAPGWHPPINVADHVVRQAEVLWLLDYFIKVATSTKRAVEERVGGWTIGC